MYQFININNEYGNIIAGEGRRSPLQVLRGNNGLG